MSNPSCSTCRWWNVTDGRRPHVHEFDKNDCCRHSPIAPMTLTLPGLSSYGPSSVFPQTRSTDFCGDHEPAGGGE